MVLFPKMDGWYCPLDRVLASRSSYVSNDGKCVGVLCCLLKEVDFQNDTSEISIVYMYRCLVFGKEGIGQTYL